MMTVRSLAPAPPPIRRSEILRYAGAKGEEEIGSLLDECIAEAVPHLTYKVAYAVFPVTKTDTGLDLGFMQTASSGLLRCLEDCEEVLVFGATVGHAYDRLLTKSAKLSPTKALLLDALGSERAEALCDAFCREMAEGYRAEGKCLSPRFSPGYGDLPLSVQTDIFRAIDLYRYAGMTLNASLLMTPKKSVTALVGIKPCTARADI